MSIQGVSVAVMEGVGRDARASRRNASVGGADGALAGAGLVQRSAAFGSGAAGDGSARLAGPLTYRRGALVGVPQGLERGRRLDVRV